MVGDPGRPTRIVQLIPGLESPSRLERPLDRLKGLKCREWAAATLPPVSRLRVLLRSPRGLLRLRGDPRADQPRAHRGRPQVDLALRRSPAARPGGRPAAVGAAVGFTPLCARATWRPSGACTSSTSRTTPSSTRPARSRIASSRWRSQGPGVRVRHGGLRLDRQSRQLGRGPRREGANRVLIFIPADLEQGKVIASLIYAPTGRVRGRTTRSTASAPRSATGTPGRS